MTSGLLLLLSRGDLCFPPLDRENPRGSTCSARSTRQERWLLHGCEEMAAHSIVETGKGFDLAFSSEPLNLAAANCSGTCFDSKRCFV